MGLFDFFKKPLILEDEVFGRLRFMRTATPCFEGKGIFTPADREIEYFIDADETGPDAGQKEFYQLIQKNYSLITSTIIDLIEKEWKDWQGDENFTIKDFNKEFFPLAISIPGMQNKPIEWHMSLDTVHDDGAHHVTVYFKDFEPAEILIDG